MRLARYTREDHAYGASRKHQKTTVLQSRHKRKRVARRQAQQRDEDLRIIREGVTYEAGDFGELEPCNEPKRKKKAKQTTKNNWSFKELSFILNALVTIVTQIVETLTLRFVVFLNQIHEA